MRLDARRPLHGGGEPRTVEGVCEGTVTHAPRGSGGFGYDPLFVVAGTDKTMAELDAAEKNRVSHRARAFAASAPSSESILEARASRSLARNVKCGTRLRAHGHAASVAEEIDVIAAADDNRVAARPAPPLGMSSGSARRARMRPSGGWSPVRIARRPGSAQTRCCRSYRSASRRTSVTIGETAKRLFTRISAPRPRRKISRPEAVQVPLALAT